MNNEVMENNGEKNNGKTRKRSRNCDGDYSTIIEIMTVLNKLMVSNQEINKKLDYLVEENKALKQEIMVLKRVNSHLEVAEPALKTYASTTQANLPSTSGIKTVQPHNFIQQNKVLKVTSPRIAMELPKPSFASIASKDKLEQPKENQWMTQKRKPMSKAQIVACGDSSRSSKTTGAIRRKWIYVGRIAGT